MLHRVLTVAVVFCSVGPVVGALPPAPPEPGYKPVDALNPSEEEAARRCWQPMFGSVPVEIAQAGSRSVLRLPCAFDRRIERASWDANIKLDLTNCQGLQFQLYADDVTPISNFTLYLQSGDGWYAGDFSLEETGRWVTVRLDKNRFHIEGRAGGWSQVRTVRFSAWRGEEKPTTLYLADIGLLNADAPVILVQDGGQRRRRDISATLQEICLPYLQVRPEEVTPALLQNRSLLVLAQETALPESSTAAVAAFLKEEPVLTLKRSAGALAGSKLTVLDIPPTEPRELMEFLARTAPEAASQAAAAFLQSVGRLGPYGSVAEVKSGIRQLIGAKLDAALQSAEKLISRASEDIKGGRYAEGFSQAQVARKLLLEAYCSAQQPQAGEQRLFWCHEASGVKGMEWDEAARILAENGFTGVIPNMCWGGVAFYKSEVLPVSPDVAEKGDQIEKCLAACKKHGIACHVWKVNWNMGWRAPADFMKKMKDAGRTQVRFDGTAEDRWLCPSSPENKQLEIDSMVEVATKYAVDGVHFDYIRYPDADACFCTHCRERFEKEAGRKVANWPADVRRDPELKEKWLQFRRDQITPVVAAVADAVHRNRPGVKVSAAVFPYWNSERDSIGQDWKLWCERGYLDFVCPMDYRPSNTQFRNMVRLQKGWAGKVPCYPGIGESVWPQRDVTKLIDQIKITREFGTGGFTVFNYAEPEAREILPLCGKGVTRRE